MMERKDKENCSNVCNSMLTDKRTSSKKSEYNYTGIRPEQFWGKTTIHGVLIYQLRSPNNPKQVRCNAAQNAVPMHDAMIASSGTGTAGPLMRTMHSLQWKSETKDKGNESMQNKRPKNRNTRFVIVKENIRGATVRQEGNAS